MQDTRVQALGEIAEAGRLVERVESLLVSVNSYAYGPRPSLDEALDALRDEIAAQYASWAEALAQDGLDEHGRDLDDEPDDTGAYLAPDDGRYH